MHVLTKLLLRSVTFCLPLVAACSSESVSQGPVSTADAADVADAADAGDAADAADAAAGTCVERTPNADATARAAPTPAEACARYAKAEYDHAYRCGHLTAAGVPRLDMLVARRTAICEAALALPGVVATAAGVEACAVAAEQAHCDGYACPLAGTLPTDARCANDWQCASGHCAGEGGLTDPCRVCVAHAQLGEACVHDSDCAIGLDCMGGACAEPRSAKLGEACGAAVARCEPDTRCSWAQKRCVPMDCACTTDADCPRDRRCVGTTCEELRTAKAGEPCESRAVVCIEGTVCGTDHVCHAREVGGPGETCREGGCLDGPCSGGVCPHPVGIGMPCGAPGTSCGPLATCIDGVCRLADTVACSSG